MEREVFGNTKSPSRNEKIYNMRNKETIEGFGFWRRRSSGAGGAVERGSSADTDEELRT